VFTGREDRRSTRVFEGALQASVWEVVFRLLSQVPVTSPEYYQPEAGGHTPPRRAEPLPSRFPPYCRPVYRVARASIAQYVQDLRAVYRFGNLIDQQNSRPRIHLGTISDVPSVKNRMPAERGDQGPVMELSK
jgi:hypothetical protein